MAQLKDLIVNGATRLIGDAYVNNIQITNLIAPTSAGGSTYGPGTQGQVLLSNNGSVYWGSAAPTVTESTVSGWGFTKNTGTITGATNNGGLKVTGTTLGHSNTAITAQATQAIYPIKIDALGHITGYGTAIVSSTAVSGGNTLSLVTTGEKYTWNNKSNLTIGTTSATAAAGNHTHTTSLATDSGNATITLAHNTTYKLTAGGTNVIFKTPTVPTAISSFTNDAGYITSADVPEGASAYTGTISAVGTTANTGTNNGFARGDHVHNITKATIDNRLGTGSGTTKYYREDGTWQVPPDTGDTHHTAYLRAGANGGTANAATTTGNTYLNLVENGANRSGVKLVPSSNMAITSDASGNVTFTATNTTYSAGTGISLSGTTFSNSGVRATTINENYLRVNTNGTNADLTIPYATKAQQDADGFIFPSTYVKLVAGTSISASSTSHADLNAIDWQKTGSYCVSLNANIPYVDNLPSDYNTTLGGDKAFMMNVYSPLSSDGTTTSGNWLYRIQEIIPYSNHIYRWRRLNYTNGSGTWIFGNWIRQVLSDNNTITTVTTSGSGNAITAISASNGAITATKGSTFLTSHQDISGKADKSATVSTVAWDSSNKKITKTINGSSTDVVQFAAGSNITLTGASGKLTIGVDGTLPVGNGGTGSTTQTASRMCYTNSSGNITSGYHYVDSTHVAIGSTTAPSTTFHVGGTASISSSLTLTGTTAATARIAFSRTGSSYYNYITVPSDSNLAIGFDANGDSTWYRMNSSALFPAQGGTYNLGDINIRWKALYSRKLNIYTTSYGTSLPTSDMQTGDIFFMYVN